jgi:hypothetical protein
MSLGRTLLRFMFLAAIGHQVTYTVVEGGIFEGMRQRVSRMHPKLDEFIHCHLCVGIWSGAVLAGVYRPNLLDAVGAKPPSVARQLANWAGDAMLIALGTRLWNETLGLLRREVQVKQKEIEKAESEGIDDSAPIEIERAMPPGISLRS